MLVTPWVMYSSQLWKKMDFLWKKHCRDKDNLWSVAFLPWGEERDCINHSCLSPHSLLEVALYFCQHVVFCTCQISVSLSLTGEVQSSGDLCTVALVGMFVKLVCLGYSSFLWLMTSSRPIFVTHIPWCVQWHYPGSHKGSVWPV